MSHVKALAKNVVDVLGGGSRAVNISIETACVETQCGTFPDAHPDKWGVGLCQLDQIGLDDIQLNGEQRHFDLIKGAFDYDIRKVQLSDAAHDPLLSLILCRLHYKRVPARFPDDLIGRAKYWKEYYNTVAGKGTVHHYLDSVRNILGEDWQ